MKREKSNPLHVGRDALESYIDIVGLTKDLVVEPAMGRQSISHPVSLLRIRRKTSLRFSFVKTSGTIRDAEQ